MLTADLNQVLLFDLKLVENICNRSGNLFQKCVQWNDWDGKNSELVTYIKA